MHPRAVLERRSAGETECWSDGVLERLSSGETEIVLEIRNSTS